MWANISEVETRAGSDIESRRQTMDYTYSRVPTDTPAKTNLVQATIANILIISQRA